MDGFFGRYGASAKFNRAKLLNQTGLRPQLKGSNMKVKENTKTIYMLNDDGIAKLKALFGDVESDQFIDTLMSVEMAMDNGDMTVVVLGDVSLTFDDSDFEPVTYFLN